MFRPSLLGGLRGLGWQIPASKLLEVRSGSDAQGAVTQEMLQRTLTVCDPTGEWVWTGAKVTESISASGQVWEGVWRKRAADEKCGDVRFMQEDMLAFGRILFPGKATSYAFQWEGALPSDWQIAINETIAKDCDSCFFDNMRPTTIGHIHGRLRPFLGDGMPAQMNKQFVSFDRGNVMTPEWVNAHIGEINDAAGGNFTGTYEEFMRTGLWSADLVDALVAPRPDAPIFLATHPILKKDYGLFMSVVRRDLSKEWDSTTNPYVLQVVWRPINKSWWTKAWEWVKRIIVKVVKFTKDTFCSLANSQVATGAALQSGNAYGMVAGAGAITLAPMLCQPKTQTCPDGSTIDINAVCPITDTSTAGNSKAWMWIVGGFAVIGAATFFLTKPKPKKKPLPSAA